MNRKQRMLAASGASAALVAAAVFCLYYTGCAVLPQDWDARRRQMVDHLRAHYGIKDARVLAAMSRVRRHEFIPASYRWRTSPYGDHACPIGHGQTISQPYIVAYMTSRMGLVRGEKVLEVGTGSGYQAAILAEMGVRVYTVEIIPQLAGHARTVLAAEGYDGVKVRTGDGYAGWAEHAPFDAVIVTCAPHEVPRALTRQLREGGRMILPVGPKGDQRLVILRKKDGKIFQESDIRVRFVPMVRGDD
jgi:protein-L-isoaspartate(D-aspartate) O-methyltransferase